MPRKAQEEGTEDVAALKARIAQLEGARRPAQEEGGWESLVRDRQKDAALATAAEAAARRDPAVRSGAKKIPPISARRRTFHVDPTIVRDSQGEPVKLDPDFHYMWVPEIDQNLNKGNQYISRYGGYGYRQVPDPEKEGEPYRWNENILLRIPNEVKADLVMALSPTQGVRAEDYYAAQAQIALDGYEEMVATPKIRRKYSADMELDDRADTI
jgi:hypothetical protein